MHFAERFSRGSRVQERELVSYIVSAFKNTPKNLVFQGSVQLDHSGHIVNVGTKARCLHRVIQLNCRELCTHASYKITRTWENFNNRGTKMILLSDELWSIANNSKSIVNQSKSIVRNNLGVCTHSNTDAYTVNTVKFIRTAFYTEHLWWLFLDSNLIFAMQILTKTKKSYFYILI